MNHPEDTASKLADYEAMRDSMIEFLWSLRRGYVDFLIEEPIGSMIGIIECSLGWVVPYVDCETKIYHAIHENNRPAAQQALDEHFAEYVNQLKGE